MAKKKMEDQSANVDFDLDMEEINSPIHQTVQYNNNGSLEDKKMSVKDTPLINCLRNERVIVRYIPKMNGIWGNNPKHVLSGGMSENATKTFVVPRLTSGMYVNVLTDSEKAFLEETMGLEYNALSIYKKVGNFWDDSNEQGINKVRLTKQDNYLDLSDPNDYIRYKILLANKDYIAPSLEALQTAKKATYQFVLISEGDEVKDARVSMSNTMRCYKEFGKIEDDIDTLRVIIETIDGRPVSNTSKIEFLQTKINSLIQSNSKLFLNVVTDPLLKTKVLIKKCIENGIIANRGNYLYLRENNQPLCEENQEPTLGVAALYLNSPKRQELLLSLQARVK